MRREEAECVQCPTVRALLHLSVPAAEYSMSEENLINAPTSALRRARGIYEQVLLRYSV